MADDPSKPTLKTRCLETNVVGVFTDTVMLQAIYDHRLLYSFPRSMFPADIKPGQIVSIVIAPF